MLRKEEDKRNNMEMKKKNKRGKSNVRKPSQIKTNHGC